MKQNENSKANLQMFTTANAREMGRRGGIAAQKVIKKKKHLRDNMKLILSLPPNEDQKKMLKKLGIPDDANTNEMLLAVSMFKQAINGDVRAAEYIRDMTGQKPETKLDKAKTKLLTVQAEALKKANDDTQELTKLDELLHGIDDIAEDNDAANN